MSRDKGELANFSGGDYVLVAREDFFKVEKLCIFWRGPQRAKKALSDCAFYVQDLRTGNFDDIHGTRLELYRDDDLDGKTIFSKFLSSETGTLVTHHLRLVEQDNKLFVDVRWKRLHELEDTLEPIARVYENVSKLSQKLLDRKNTPAALCTKAHAALGLRERVM